MKMTARFVLAVLACTLQCIFSAGQTNPNLETGLKPYGSYHGGNIDSVSLTNGNLTLHIPLYDYPQRGKLRYQPELMYNNKGWYVGQTCDPTTGNCTGTWYWKGAGVSLMTTPDGVGVTWRVVKIGSNAYVTIFTAGTSDGSIHQLASNQAGGMESIDGTGIYYDGSTTNTGVLRDRRGVLSSLNSKDTNGNFFSYDANQNLTDTLGRPIPVLASTTDTTGCTGPLPIAYAQLQTIPAFKNGTRAIKLCYAGVALQTNFQAQAYLNQIQTRISEGAKSAAANQVIQSVVLYNGAWSTSPAWTFEYNSRDAGDSSSVNYGDLTKITLPTGGTISYTWGSLPMCGNSITPMSRGVTSRTVNDGSGPQLYKYSGGVVTDPAGNETVHVITGLNNSCSFYETQTQYFTGSHTSGQLLKTVATEYRWIANPFDTYGDGTQTVADVFPIRTTTTWPSGKVTKIEHDYDSSLSFFAPGQGQKPASYGDVIQTREYDFGSGTAPTSPLRTTITNYAWQSNSNYLGVNILDVPCLITVYSAGSVPLNSTCTPPSPQGNQVAQTSYGYDESSLQLSNIGTQHDGSYPPGLRGNRTSVSRWLNTTGSTLKTTTTYYDTGEPYVITGPAPGNHTTTYSYGTGFVSGSTFAGAYPTQVTNSLGQNTFYDYDFGTGLRTDVKDPNQSTLYPSHSDYDLLSRILLSKAPDGGTVTFAYTDTQPPTFTATSTISSSVNRLDEADLDGLGRLAHTKLTSDLEGTVSVDLTYDPDGRKYSESNPHRPIADGTEGITTIIYDGLSRITKTTAQDGGITVSDYSNFPAVTVTDEAGMQRRSFTDGLGRLVQVDEPAPLGPPTAATGSSAISGAEQSVQVLSQAASGAYANIVVSGIEQRLALYDCPGKPYSCYAYDGGSISVTISGVGTLPITWGQNSTNWTIATGIANGFNYYFGNMVSASAGQSGTSSVVYFATKQVGSGTNYPLAVSIDYDTTDFSHASYTLTPSGPTFTGGHDNIYSTVYDSGTVSVAMTGCTATVSYGQTGNSTAGLVAGALASSVNGNSSCPVTASAPSSTLNLTAKQTGGSVNYSITGSSSTSQGSYFSRPSFTASSGTVSGGLDHTGGLLTPASTFYTYDALDNLIQVQQRGFTSDSTQWRTRNFQYNSLSQLTSATNPESGTITYTYDNDGNVTSKTSPAPNQTGTATQTITYCYDALNRLTKKFFAAALCTQTAPVNYFYDQTSYNGLTILNGIGRRTGMSDGSGQTAWSYDVVGRTTTEQRTIGTVTKQIGYTYNLDGSPDTLTYPSGRQLKFQYNPAERLLSAADTGNSITYATGATYWPAGALHTVVNGPAGSFGGITVTNSYNPRQQPVTLQAAVVGSSQNVLNLGYDFHLGAGDNGNVFQINNSRDTTRTQSFTYDQLNRLISAQTPNSTLWGNSYVYDGWSNLLQKTVTKGTAESLSVVATVQNRMSGYSYDAAGNLLNDGLGHAFTYDPENRIASTGAITYTYDGDGQRVSKSNGKLYWGAGPLAESDASGNPTEEYIFFNGMRIARGDVASGTIHYYFSDHLGSSNVITNASGTIEEESDFYPFGGERIITDAGIGNNFKFTGKERDGESSLDYFGARYYGSTMGRWMSPDWAARAIAVPYATFGNPESLNLYSYVGNNPLRHADLDGHEGGLCYGCGPAGETLAPGDPRYPGRTMSETEKQIDKGILELASAYATGGLSLEALGAGAGLKAAIGGIASAGLAVSGSWSIIGTTLGVPSKQVNEASTAVTTVTNPAGIAVTIATGGNIKAGAVAADLSSAAMGVAKPAEAAKDLAGTALTVNSVVQDLKTGYSAVMSLVSPPSPPPPPPPPPLPTCTGGAQCR